MWFRVALFAKSEHLIAQHRIIVMRHRAFVRYEKYCECLRLQTSFDASSLLIQQIVLADFCCEEFAQSFLQLNERGLECGPHDGRASRFFVVTFSCAGKREFHGKGTLVRMSMAVLALPLDHTPSLTFHLCELNNIRWLVGLSNG